VCWHPTPAQRENYDASIWVDLTIHAKSVTGVRRPQPALVSGSDADLMRTTNLLSLDKD